MRSRQDIVEIFSSFIQFNADRFSNWATEPKLRRSMQKSLAQSPQATTKENFWALYWHKLWLAQPESLAFGHLYAYLQEAGYWAAQNIVTNFTSSQQTVADCFQIAIAKVDKILQGFNSQQGFNLKNYASAIFTSTIKETLRQRQEVDICTDWSLLRKLSHKRLEEALQNAGLSPEKIASYLIAWNCFKTIYVPTQAGATRQLAKPDSATWEAIAKLYNSQNPSTKIHQAETLEQWMLACAKAARSYLYPTVASINTPKPGQDAGEWLDNLPELQGESLLTNIITQEELQNRQTQQQQISEVLIAAIAKLDVQAQQILQLYYGGALTQQQMAAQLDIKQYTISRRLTKCREELLKALAQWSQDLHISLTSDVLKNISAVLDEWLQSHYSQTDMAAGDSPTSATLADLKSSRE
ncbi:sigma-70 family RNA polymerase sigma factor [Gloeocapsopsis crepidinum LEGE 06123]|uniref:Sigma-70 family RNA polymerase sigma factor n=1 Tax=Gloeocapsopsis crepidinum LEGE 06123 TaxID=588587 RepID=A0ABR9UMF7_9CHRO|nr:sigma-70 family RNA polymerase sigma factor [Gloeocapsopsis crepidinum]MBE9189451.1 sigma-70 family RNA polymerase sigma factor [Gloeocapsopsis crepidinum LEGE 06123]